MTRTQKIWLGAFVLVCLGLFLPLGIMGLRDPLSLTPFVEEGGPIELGSALAWLFASGGAFGVAGILRRRERRYRGWMLLGGLCLFFAGEEVSWGGAYGWKAPLALLGYDLADLHNWAVNVLLGTLEAWGLESPPALAVLGLGVLGVLTVPLWWLLKRRSGQLVRRWKAATERLPLTFFLLGAVLLVLGNLLDLWDAVGLPYFTGQWILEEALEFLGAVAVLFGVLAKLQALRRGEGRDLPLVQPRAR